MSSPTNTELRMLFDGFQKATLERDPEIYALFAEDGVIEWPFARQGAPTRIEGQQKIRALYLAWFQSPPLIYREFSDTGFFSTTDAGRVLVEYRIHGTAHATNKSFMLAVIRHMVFQEGKISLLREYMNPEAMAEALRP